MIQSPQEKVVEVARAILCGDLGIIEGSRRLSSLRAQVRSLDHDPDFFPFVGIDSETDHLPIGEKYRQLWASEALAREDLKIKAAEEYRREEAFTACRRLLEHFGKTSSHPTSET
jgi:hypothetical protein